MSLQWTAIAGCLYIELALTILLLLPFVPSSGWQRVFHSGPLTVLSHYANQFYTFFLVPLVICFADSIREIYKYDHSDESEAALTNNPVTVEHVQMKLFRAQRNFYIAGFALFLWFVIRRLVTLISSEATLSAGKAAAIKQAQSASDAAKRLMDAKDKGDEKDNAANELDDVRKQLVKAKEALRTKEADLEAMKAQAVATNREYDRLSAEFQQLQTKQQEGDKKSS